MWQSQYTYLGNRRNNTLNLTFIGPCIANIFAEYNQQDATFHNLFIPARRSTCFRPFFRPSSAAQNCTQRQEFVRPILLPAASLAAMEHWCVQFWAPDDGRKNGQKHVERLAEINKLWNVASCWLYSANTLNYVLQEIKSRFIKGIAC